MTPLPRSAAAAITTAALVGLSACTTPVDASGPSASASGDAAAGTLVRSALTAAEAVESVHFALTTSGDLERQQVVTAEGDLVVRPRTSARGTATVRAGGDRSAVFVLVDGAMFVDVDGTGFVAHRAGTSFYDVGTLFDPKDGIPDLLRQLRDASIAGDEQVSGTPATRVTGTAPASDLAELAGIRAAHGSRTAQAPVTVWIQQAAPHNVLQLSGAPQPNTEVRISLSDWGAHPSISAPSTTRTVPSGAIPTPAGATAKAAK